MRWITLVPAVVALCFSLAKADPTTDREAATKQLLLIVNNRDTPMIEFRQDEDKAYKIVEQLLKQGADINAIGPDGKSVFQVAMDGNMPLCSPKILALLMDYHPDLNCRNSNGDGVVAITLNWSQYDYARKFIDAGAPIDEANNDGVTPLMKLAQESLVVGPSPTDFIKLLLAKGADPERRDKQGKSAIDRAIASGDLDLLLVLDAKGAHRDAYDAVKKKVLQRQLSLAVGDAIYNEAKSAEAMVTIEKLIQEGIDSNEKGVFYSPITIFQQSLIESISPTKGRRLKVVKYLLEHGADPNKPFSDGTIPLEAAIHEPEVFALLRAYGAKLSRNLELAQAASHAEIEDIREATFRHQFGMNASGQQTSAKVYFLSITDDKTGKSIDPSAAFLKRFAGNQPRVGGVSECKASAEKGVLDIKTGEQGLIFSVDTIRWISETKVAVGGGSYEAGLSASGNTYMLEKKDGKWVVVKDVRNWIS